MKENSQKVLIVDDEPVIGRLISKVLLSSGRPYEIEICTHGETAIKKVHETLPDVIFLDINLPGKNGVEVCRAIREYPVHEYHPHIIAISGNITGENKSLIMEAGADIFLPKPFTREELLDAVKSKKLI